MRIAIVNNMIITVEALKRILINVPECELAWIANNGFDAVTKCAQDTPDLILMDLMMPVMNGVDATRQIMQNSPCAILIVTASARKNTAQVFAAMGYGALDAVNMTVLSPDHDSLSTHTLLAKITTIRKLLGKLPSKIKSHTGTSISHSPLFPLTSQFPPLIVIGSSTGGPHALAAILSRIPANFPGSFAIVQHIDAQFTPGLVEWLNQQTPLTVTMAQIGNRLELGKVLIAGTNDHLKLQSNLMLTYSEEPINYPYRPSVDVFFKSVAQYWLGQGTAILLTGMGHDGAEGLNVLRQKGWHTIAQNEQSCVVYGMPKAATQLGAVVESLSIEAIASTLIKRFM